MEMSALEVASFGGYVSEFLILTHLNSPTNTHLSRAVQKNFRRTLLVSSREENISRLGAAVGETGAPSAIFF